ncbi:MAG: hypothetical protein ABJD07_03410 [Gemmatimonadaceae bacterium]
MPSRASLTRLATFLWTFAALITIGGVIRHCVRYGEWQWGMMGAALFCVAMGIGSRSYGHEQ